MANSEAAMVNITSQDPTQPIIQAIRVERVVSKITFTPNNNDNKYNVKVKVTTIPTVTTDGWLKTTTADKTSYIYITKLNKALLDADNAEIWVLLMVETKRADISWSQLLIINIKVMLNRMKQRLQ